MTTDTYVHTKIPKKTKAIIVAKAKQLGVSETEIFNFALAIGLKKVKTRK